MRSEEKGALGSWVMVVALAAAVAAWGLFLHATIGDRGQPPWDFDAVEDLPGSSPYAVHGPKESPSLVSDPDRERSVLAPQHVGGEKRP